MDYSSDRRELGGTDVPSILGAYKRTLDGW